MTEGHESVRTWLRRLWQRIRGYSAHDIARMRGAIWRLKSDGFGVPSGHLEDAMRTVEMRLVTYMSNGTTPRELDAEADAAEKLRRDQMWERADAQRRREEAAK